MAFVAARRGIDLVVDLRAVIEDGRGTFVAVDCTGYLFRATFEGRGGILLLGRIRLLTGMHLEED